MRRVAAFVAPVAEDAGAVASDAVSLDVADAIYQAFSLAVANAMWLALFGALGAAVVVALFVPELTLRHTTGPGAEAADQAEGRRSVIPAME